MAHRLMAVVMALGMIFTTPDVAVADNYCGPPDCDWPPPGCKPTSVCVYVPVLARTVCFIYYPCRA